MKMKLFLLLIPDHQSNPPELTEFLSAAECKQAQKSVTYQNNDRNVSSYANVKTRPNATSDSVPNFVMDLIYIS